MALSTGTRIGSYETVNAIGAGGMGEVYRARDTRLDRTVAIKVLPELFGSDPDRLARFQREAKTLAALNHPNVAQIYGVENVSAEGGGYALAMEFVDGEDLSQRLARGPLPIDEAVAIARQILVSSAPAIGMTWRRDGRELIFADSDEVFAVPVTYEGGALSVGKPVALMRFEPGSGIVDVAADGQRFLYASERDDSVSAKEIRIVLHWLDDLKAKSVSK